MGREFTRTAKIFRHNCGYSIHPNKIIIESMGWKENDKLEVVPIPLKGFIVLKGRKTGNSKFVNSFEKLLIRNNKTHFKRKLKEFYSLRRKIQLQDYHSYAGEVLYLDNAIKRLDKILNDGNKFISELDKKRRKMRGLPKFNLSQEANRLVRLTSS
jgi:hypothetical protein